MTLCSTEHPFGQVGSIVLAVLPAGLLPTPILVKGRGMGMKSEKESLDTVHCSATAKTLVCCQQFQSEIQNVQAAMKKLNSISGPLQYYS